MSAAHPSTRLGVFTIFGPGYVETAIMQATNAV